MFTLCTTLDADVLVSLRRPSSGWVTCWLDSSIKVEGRARVRNVSNKHEAMYTECRLHIQAYYNTILNTTRVFVTMTTVEALKDMPHRTRERVDVKFSKFYCILKVIKQRVNDLREFAVT